ncbi:flavin reductase family protein [Thioclava sp. GXIMD2076]|uniref:flavin reductase family protein n=1 Tax=unclassified Thioclava TaxID=2621713 RepID=UPI0030CEC791
MSTTSQLRTETTEPLGTATPPRFLPDQAQFRAAMRRPVSTVAIVTAGARGERAGVTITAACSLSDSPPSVLICIHRDSAALETIRKSGHFALNFLSAKQTELANLFAGRSALRGDARFSDEDWELLESGAPVAKNALTVFDCILAEELPSPTHAILIGRVAGISASSEDPALLYSNGSYQALVQEPAE